MAHIQCVFYSKSLKKNTIVQVILPTPSADDFLADKSTDYFQDTDYYRTLYLLHGSYGGCTDWLRRTSVERYAEERKLAVVMPSGENSGYLNMHHGENYLEFIGSELPEFMRMLILPLSPNREDTYIAGLSMGGYGAFRIALEYHETFGYAASISGVLDLNVLTDTGPHITKMPSNSRRAGGLWDIGNISEDDDLVFLLKKRLENKTVLPKMYACCGMEDFLLSASESFVKKARELGAEIVYGTHAGTHDWDYWDTHIKDVMDWLVEKNI